MRRVLPLLFIATVLFAGSQSAYACVCVFEPGKPSEKQRKAAIAKDFNESASVFSGEVLALDAFTVKFRLITMWKGNAFEEFTISTGAKKISEDSYSSSSCDYGFKTGEKYLVYARINDDNQLVARSCTRTNVLSKGEMDIPELDILSPGAYHAPSPPSVSRVGNFSVLAKSNPSSPRDASNSHFESTAGDAGRYALSHALACKGDTHADENIISPPYH
jgi:hypothetical protein